MFGIMFGTMFGIMFGIMFDGATDKNMTEMELVYARLVVDGQVRNMYVPTQPPQHALAEGICGAINEVLVQQLAVQSRRSGM